MNAYGTLHHLSEEKSVNGAGRVQMVEHSTEKPGANAIRTWFESPVQQTFSPSVNFQCRLSYCVHTLHSPLCALTCINICAHIESPKRWQLHLCLHFGHANILHTLIGMGSAALAATAPYPGKAIQIPIRDKEILKKYIIKKIAHLLIQSEQRHSSSSLNSHWRQSSKHQRGPK